MWQDDAAAWERQVYTFAQARQLPVLAPHIPIGIMAPQLRRQAYEMVRTQLSLENRPRSLFRQ